MRHIGIDLLRILHLASDWCMLDSGAVNHCIPSSIPYHHSWHAININHTIPSVTRLCCIRQGQAGGKTSAAYPPDSGLRDTHKSRARGHSGIQSGLFSSLRPEFPRPRCRALRFYTMQGLRGGSCRFSRLSKHATRTTTLIHSIYYSTPAGNGVL